MPSPTSTRLLPFAALALLAAFGLSACGDETTSERVVAAPQTASGEITLDDGWVKAADSGMSAVFGELNNGTDEDLTLVEVTSPISPSIQQHETLAQDDGSMAMQENQDGFVVPAGSHHHLAPGADHLMLMSLSSPIKAGDLVPFTLRFDDGTTLEVSLVARDFDGADEDYHSHGDDDHDMGDPDDTDDMGADDHS